MKSDLNQERLLHAAHMYHMGLIVAVIRSPCLHCTAARISATLVFFVDVNLPTRVAALGTASDRPHMSKAETMGRPSNRSGWLHTWKWWGYRKPEV